MIQLFGGKKSDLSCFWNVIQLRAHTSHPVVIVQIVVKRNLQECDVVFQVSPNCWVKTHGGWWVNTCEDSYRYITIHNYIHYMFILYIILYIHIYIYTYILYSVDILRDTNNGHPDSRCDVGLHRRGPGS